MFACLFRTALACAAALGACLAAAPAHALAVGDKVEGRFVLGAKQIPLPQGTWTVAGLGTQPFKDFSVGAFGAIQTAILVQTRSDALTAVVEVNGNAIQVNDGWGRTRACAPDGRELMLLVRYRTGWETSCQFVRASRFDLDAPGPAAWEDAKHRLRQAKLAAPKVWLTAGFRVSDRQDIVDVRVHLNPADLLGPDAALLADAAEWSPDAVRADGLRQGSVQAIAAWATGFDAWVERGLRNRIADAPGPLPRIAVKTAAYEDAKLAELRRLFDEGRIDKAQYDAQAAAARAEAPEHKPSDSLVSQSVKKNISFRSLGTFVDYGIAYVVTASNYVSWGIAITLNATDSVWFVLNDQYWDNYYAKLNTRDSDRVVDFIYLGDAAARSGAPA